MFKEFSIEQIFTIKKVYGRPQKTYELGNIPYVTGTKDNNGVVGFVSADEKSISKGNCISVDPITGLSCYQPVDFVGRGFSGASINLLYNDNLDEKTALFMCSAIEKVASSVAAYTNLFNSTRLATANIKVPVIENFNLDHEYTVDDIDWQYMRDDITELEHDRITDLDAYLQATGLNDYELTEDDKKALSEKVEWGSFTIGDVFEPLKVGFVGEGQKIGSATKEPDAIHCVPLTCAKIGDNGIMYWGKKGDFITYTNALSVIADGAVSAGLVYAQPEEAGAYSHSYFIDTKEKNVSRYAKQFLSSVLTKVIYPKYSREDAPRWNKIESEEIHLPIKSDGTPDFGYMERYIRAIEKVVIADVVKYKDKVIEETRKVVGA